MKESNLKRNVEYYIVQYLIKVIDSEKTNGKQKFNSLLMLKDIMKIQNISFNNYVAKKILKQLLDYANSNEKYLILKKINPNIDR